MKGISKYGSWLKDSIEKRGMTQEQFADMMGVNPSMVSRWIHTEITPNMKTMERINAILCKEVKPQDGHWMRMSYPKSSYQRFSCSVCGGNVYFRNMNIPYKICPYCMSRMEEKKDA